KEANTINNIELVNSCEIIGLEGEELLEQIVMHDKRKNITKKLKVEGLFVTLGRKPDLSWLEIDIKTNKNGYVMVDKNCQTNQKGVFACGDITSRKLKQIVTACSDGAIAASFITAKG
ncbi:MAG: NAD(P)/FAD-dependent oxidoreductase, partial [Clostridia bacterium]